MLLTASLEWNIDLSNSYIIGDRESDIAAGKSAGVKEGFLIEQNKENALHDAVSIIINL